MPESPTTTTLRYLFASEWAGPPGAAGWNMRVPGGKVNGPETGASLLEIAVWSLREQGLVQVEQLREVESERVVTMGGHSFTRVQAAGVGEPLAGLEGALLAKAREPAEAGFLGRLDDKFAKVLSGDDEHGLRGLVLALGLNDSQPWVSVANHCRDEARELGLIELEGRIRRKPVVSDAAAVEALRPRDEKVTAARQEYREREPKLDEAVISDCMAAISWAHTN